MTRFRDVAIWLLFLAFAGSPWTALRAQSIRVLPNRIRAPSLDAPGDWINTSGPLRLADLRGKFVILDFWTYCCVNCMHILPELKKLEERYPNSLVVIGVHSPKFAKERDTENVREAVVREKIVHPVLNDPQKVLWSRYEVGVWPSLRVIDPEGYVVAVHSGETTFPELDRLMRGLIPSYRRRGVLDEQPLRFDLEVEKHPETPLRFPGKVLADGPGNRLFIADTYHNRIVVTSLDGTLRTTIGSGQTGRADGGFEEASFDHPQGMALHGETLYIADTENHLIRAADLTARQVKTVAGTGVQRKRQEVRGSTRPRGMQLASPWDLLVVGDRLFIAMAGSHQIWTYDLDGSHIGPYAGNGSEDIVDGPLLTRQAYQPGGSEFAQPSGLGSDGQWVFVADSEGSSIRAVPLDRTRDVVTVLGTARLAQNRLFTFGDRDGDLRTAMLQHPVGLTFHDQVIYIADTYNDKVRALDIPQRRVRTIAGATPGPAAPAEPVLNEPSGVSVAAGKLYIADTNAHRVRVVDLRNPAHPLSTLAIPDLKPPQLQRPAWTPLPNAQKVQFTKAAARAVNGQLRFRIKLALPIGYKWNEAAGFVAHVDTEAGSALLSAEQLAAWADQSVDAANEVVLDVPVNSVRGTHQIRVALTYYFCREGNEAICRIGEVHWEGDVSMSPDGAREIVLERQIPQPLGD